MGVFGPRQIYNLGVTVGQGLSTLAALGVTRDLGKAVAFGESFSERASWRSDSELDQAIGNTLRPVTDMVSFAKNNVLSWSERNLSDGLTTTLGVALETAGYAAMLSPLGRSPISRASLSAPSLGEIIDGAATNSSLLKQTGGGGYTGSADELYDAIRASNSDVSSIASNTGFKPENIQKIKDHVFNNEHLLDRYVDLGEPAVVAKFDSNMAQGQAWQRLENGTHVDADITWLKHETAERWYELKYKSGYSEAHDRVNWRWDGNPWEAQ